MGLVNPQNSSFSRAIELGFETYSLTEHPPLPVHFQDPAPDKSCGMVPEDLEPYLSHAKKLSDRFSQSDCCESWAGGGFYSWV